MKIKQWVVISCLVAMFLVPCVSFGQPTGYQGLWKDTSGNPIHNFYVQHYLQGNSTVVIYTRDAINFYAFLGSMSGNAFEALSLDPDQDRRLQLSFAAPTTGTATITDRTVTPNTDIVIDIARTFQAQITDRSGIWKDGSNVLSMYVQDYTVGSTVIVYTFDAVDFKAFLTNVSGDTFTTTDLGDGTEQMTMVFANASSGNVGVAPAMAPTMLSPLANDFSYPVSKTFYPTPLPLVSFMGDPRVGAAPLTVNFTDQSAGVKDAFGWNFGDGGTSTLQNPQHTYNNPGTYDVSLSVSNISGSSLLTQNGYVSVAATGTPPLAQFSGMPTSGPAPLSVSFIDTSLGSPTSWAWNFGDAGDPSVVQSTAQNPSHVFANPGVYTVTLIVSNAFGSNGATRVNYINVSAADVMPTADFIATTATTGPSPLFVAFQDQSTGSPTSWQWNFGDAGDPNIVQSTLQNPVHNYSAVGTYSVKLRVSNSAGSNTKTRVNYVTVTSGSATVNMGYGGF